MEERNHSCKVGRGHYGEHSHEINKILDKWFRCCLKIFLFLALMAICSAEQNDLCNFGREHYGEHSCEIILNLDQWLKRKCLLKKKFRHNAHLTEDNGRRPITIAHIDPSAMVR